MKPNFIRSPLRANVPAVKYIDPCLPTCKAYII